MNKKYPTFFLTWFNKFLWVPYPVCSLTILPLLGRFGDASNWEKWSPYGECGGWTSKFSLIDLGEDIDEHEEQVEVNYVANQEIIDVPTRNDANVNKSTKILYKRMPADRTKGGGRITFYFNIIQIGRCGMPWRSYYKIRRCKQMKPMQEEYDSLMTNEH